MLPWQIINMDYGMKEKNPIDHVRFYMKDLPTKAIKVRKDQVSQMLPDTFFEQHIRFFCKKTDDQSILAARTCFYAWCKDKNLAQPKVWPCFQLVYCIVPYPLSVQ